MPKGILAAIKASEMKRHGADEAEDIAYATANARGYMHGSKETEKGRRAEAKFQKDHPHKTRGWGR